MKRLSKAFNVVTDVIFFLVMGLLIVYLIMSFSAKFSNGVPSYFGYSYVRVMSRSMEASEIKKGDIVVLKRVNVSEIKKGDVIAYYLYDGASPNFTGTPSENPLDYATNQQSHNTTIIFHQVENIKVDKDGQTWFQTYGTSNINSETGNPILDPWVRGDYVIGVYNQTWIASVIKFVSSTAGIITIVVVPSAVVCLMLLFSMIDTIDKMMKMKKLAAALPTTSGLIEGEEGAEAEAPPQEEEDKDE